MSRGSHRPSSVRPRQRRICYRPKIGSKGQLSFRNEARRKARHPEVQHLLLSRGRGGTAGLARSCPSPDPTVLLPLEGYRHWLLCQYQPASTRGEALNNCETVQDHKPGFSRSTQCLPCSITPLQRSPGLIEPFGGSPSPQTLNCTCDFLPFIPSHTSSPRCCPFRPPLGVASSPVASTLAPDWPQYTSLSHFYPLCYFSWILFPVPKCVTGDFSDFRPTLPFFPPLSLLTILRTSHRLNTSIP